MIEIWVSDDTTSLDEIELMSPLRRKKYKAIKTGRWEIEHDLYGAITCSICKCKALTESDFCPNCGADMREVEE